MQPPAPDSPIQQRLAHLRRLKDLYRGLAEQADNAKADHDRYQAAIFEEMRDDRLDGVKHDGVHYIPKATVYASVQDLDAFAAWCKANDLIEEFIVDSAAKGRVNELVRRCLDNAEELPPGIGWYEKQYVAITAG